FLLRPRPRSTLLPYTTLFRSIPAFAGQMMTNEEFAAATAAFRERLRQALTAAGYPEKANMEQVNYPMVILLCAYLVILVTMVYRSEEHTSELQSRENLVCRLL